MVKKYIEVSIKASILISTVITFFCMLIDIFTQFDFVKRLTENTELFIKTELKMVFNYFVPALLTVVIYSLAQHIIRPDAKLIGLNEKNSLYVFMLMFIYIALYFGYSKYSYVMWWLIIFIFASIAFPFYMGKYWVDKSEEIVSKIKAIPTRA